MNWSRPRRSADVPEAEPAGASADVPAMLQAAHDYIVANQSGPHRGLDLFRSAQQRLERRERPLGGAARRLRRLSPGRPLSFAGLSPSRRPTTSPVRLTGLRRRQTERGGELLLSLRLTRSSPATEPSSVPVQFEIEGARSVVDRRDGGRRVRAGDHPLPLGERPGAGLGRVSIPADANLADNEFFFAFDPNRPAARSIVADDAQAVGPLQLGRCDSRRSQRSLRGRR